MKRYVPVRNFERQTGTCPTYIAWRVLDEARDYLRTPISESYTGRLARRTEAVYRAHPSWRRQLQRVDVRDQLMMWMRHWLAGVLAKEAPSAFRRLPEGYCIGHPPPPEPAPPVEKSLRKVHAVRRKGNRASAFVHGFELLLP